MVHIEATGGNAHGNIPVIVIGIVLGIVLLALFIWLLGRQHNEK
jgi:hypothetical protein